MACMSCGLRPQPQPPRPNPVAAIPSANPSGMLPPVVDLKPLNPMVDKSQMGNRNFLQELRDPNSELYVGREGGLQQVPRFAPNQQSAMNELINYSLPQLTQGKFDFDPIRQNAIKSFYERQAPLLAERLPLGSSGYRNTLKTAGADLESQLASLESNYNLQRQSQLQGLLNTGLTPSFETIHIPREPGAFEAGAGPLAQGLGQAATLAAPALVGGALAAGKGVLGGLGWAADKLVQAFTSGPKTAEAAQIAATAGSVLGPTAASALPVAITSGLTPAGAVILPIAAGLAIAGGTWLLYDTIRGWIKGRKVNKQDVPKIQQLQQQNQVPQQRPQLGQAMQALGAQ